MNAMTVRHESVEIEKKYRQILGCNRLCARFQANQKESHFSSMKRIMKYLKGTTSIGLWYPKGSVSDLVGYSDSDYVGCKIDRKNTSGTCHILGNALVSWSCKKQAPVTLSTTEA